MTEGVFLHRNNVKAIRNYYSVLQEGDTGDK